MRTTLRPTAVGVAILGAVGCVTGASYSHETTPKRSEAALQLAGGDLALAEALERAADEYTCPLANVTTEPLHDWGNGNATFAVHACGHDAVYTCLSLDMTQVCLHDTWGPAAPKATGP